MKRVAVWGLIACWLALGLAQALPHVHDGSETPATHACVFCRVQSASPLAEAGPALFAGLLLAGLLVVVVPFTLHRSPCTGSYASRAPPLLA